MGQPRTVVLFYQKLMREGDKVLASLMLSYL